MILITSILCFFCFFDFFPKTQPTVYLSWENDPATSMVIHWYTENKEDQKIKYRKQGESTWSYKQGTYVCLQCLSLRIYSVELVDLEPNTEYEFSVGEKIYRFRSLPVDLRRSLCFAVGGDVYYYLDLMRKMALQIAARAPDFVIVGGDIAYTRGSKQLLKQKDWQEKRWVTFFNTWSEIMKTPDGRLIPIIGVLGNHDVEHVGLEEEMVYKFLPEIKSFKVLDIGNNLSLFLLDTEHRYRVKAQEKWLEKELEKREKNAYKMAVYHVSGYPSVYSEEGTIPRRVRKHWHPHFDRYHLQIAFENHNHAYKRTYPLKNGEYNPDGVIYMGDGSWGVWTRTPREKWYLEKAAKANSVCLVQIDQEKAVVDALDIKGRVIDSVKIRPQGAGFAP
ncbi:purple acid phosphatase family protein [Candidatus Rhabdochlamydia porcellionis]|jgi:acid phosphatase type 7|uniref:Purple acid Phosphatase n=1 Tax=Candidatus Rhabdochlamydia porcellionis TaxID=225148 RepID=A0ABX8Z0M8_9BACT|nr:metallophosphoesterase family protein [Candidatus Rhabdochlamydia porcellionis]QZA59226.1 Purple acid Phosphatase [Candidatus Rhabdochlamydia porcellionis]